MRDEVRVALALRHAEQLRQALAESTKFDRHDIAELTGKGDRTVTNWLSRTKPTLPDDKDRQALRRMFPGYDAAGDAVERAVLASPLTEDRQHDVIGYYKKRLREQREEATG